MGEKLNLVNKWGKPLEHGSSWTYKKGCRCDECRGYVREANQKSRDKVRNEVVSGDREVPHGTLHGYVTYGCRCDKCRSANRQYLGTNPDNHRNPEIVRVDFTPSGKPTVHGRPTTYSRGCRCDECRDAHRERMYRTRDARVAALESGEISGKHGTANLYSNYGCRCDKCKGAWKEKLRNDVEKRKSGSVRNYKTPDQVAKGSGRRRTEYQEGAREIKHGTNSGYGTYKCRCDECKGFMRDYRKRRKLDPNNKTG